MRRLMAIMISIGATLALGACASAPTTTSAPAPAAPVVSLGTLTVSDPWIRPANAGAMMDMGATSSPESQAGHGATAGAMMDMGATSSPESQAGHGEAAGAMVNTGGYMTLSNNGAEADFLLAAAADDLAEAIELHTMEMDGEVMRMRQVERIEIPAGGVAELRPGGLHIMFIGLKRSLEPGETVKLRLSFERGGSVEVEAVVRNP